MVPSLVEHDALGKKLSRDVLEKVELIAAKKYPILNVSYSVSINDADSSITANDVSSEIEYKCSQSDQIFISITISRPWVDEDFIPVGEKNLNNEPKTVYSLIPNLPDNRLSNKSTFEESGWVVLGYQKSIVSIKKFPFGAWTKTQNNGSPFAELSMLLQTTLPSNVKVNSVVSLKLLVISDTWIGSDQEFELKFCILE